MGYVQDVEELATHLRQLILLCEAHTDSSAQRIQSTSYRAPLIHSSRGRPSFHITRHQLQYLSSLSFNWTRIASLLQVSRMTVHRQRDAFGMLNNTSEHLTNADVRRHITHMHRQFPHKGESMVIGRFCAIDFRVTRESIRQAIRETDPLNTALRWPGGLTGR